MKNFLKGNWLKKFTILLLLFLFLLPLITPKAKAEDSKPWYTPNFKEWYLKVYDPDNPTEIFGERYTNAQVNWVIFGLFSFLINQTGDEKLYHCLMSKEIKDCGDAIKESVQRIISLNQKTEESNFLAAFTERPISLISYLQNQKEKFSLVKEVNAQTNPGEGFGFGAAKSIQGLWQITRDLSYFLLILVIIAFAFMIMFRVRISPQTVISVQSALPKVIITLILITFSYAIAGFLIDLMYVVIGIFSFLLSNRVTDLQATELFGYLTTNGNILTLFISYLLTFGIASFIALQNGFGVVFTVFGINLILMVLLMVVALIMLLVTFFKTLWMLLKAYVFVLLQIIIGPFQILLGAIGNQGGFSAWLKNILANLAIFPVTGLMFILSFIFLRGVFDSTTIFGLPLASIPGFDFLTTNLIPFKIKGGFLGSHAWTPPLTWGANAEPLIYLSISFVIITMVPKVADIIKGMIEGKPFSYGSAIGEAVAPVVGAGKMAIQYPATATELKYKEEVAKGEITPSTAKRKKFFDMTKRGGITN